MQGVVYDITLRVKIYWGDNMDFNILLFNDFETLDIFGPIEIFASKVDHKINYYSLNGGVIVSRQGAKIITEKISDANKKGSSSITRRYGNQKVSRR